MVRLGSVLAVTVLLGGCAMDFEDLPKQTTTTVTEDPLTGIKQTTVVDGIADGSSSAKEAMVACYQYMESKENSELEALAVMDNGAWAYNSRMWRDVTVTALGKTPYPQCNSPASLWSYAETHDSNLYAALGSIAEGLPKMVSSAGWTIFGVEAVKGLKSAFQNAGDSIQVAGDGNNVSTTRVNNEIHATSNDEGTSTATSDPSVTREESAAQIPESVGGVPQTLEACLQRAEDNPGEWTNSNGTAIFSWNSGNNPTDCEGEFARR